MPRSPRQSGWILTLLPALGCIVTTVWHYKMLNQPVQARDPTRDSLHGELAFVLFALTSVLASVIAFGYCFWTRRWWCLLCLAATFTICAIITFRVSFRASSRARPPAWQALRLQGQSADGEQERQWSGKRCVIYDG